MGQSCHHAHSVHSQQADKWTNFTAIAEASSSFISDAYWIANIIDTMTGLDAEIIGLSYYSLAFGSVIALLSAGGAAYCHRVLNKIHQNTEEFEPSDDSSAISMNNENTPLINCKKKPLTLFEKGALVGDFISHTGDTAGPITFVCSLAAPKLSLWSKVGMHISTTLFGGLSSIANWRTCKNAMEKDHPNQSNNSLCEVGHGHSHISA